MTSNAPTLTPLIISGAPRSGTSLIYNLFDGHDDVNWLVDEGFLFEYLYDLGEARARLLIDAVPADLEALIKGLRDKQIMPPMHEDYTQSLARGSVSEVAIKSPWSEERFRAQLGDRPTDSFPAFWEWLARAYVAGEGQTPRRYAAMKSPDFGKSMASALALHPDAKSIIILRDPLRSLDSLKRSRELRGEKLLTWPQFALSVGSFADMADRIAAADQTRLKVVRYEDLTVAPEETMRSLAAWLDIPFTQSLVEPTMRGQHWPGISSFAATDGIESAPSARPLQALSRDEADFVRRSLADFRAAHRYTD